MTEMLNADTKSFGAMMREGRGYVVPEFQRNYSWDKQNWEILWQDISEGMDSSRIHYMGSIVTILEEGGENYELIDGQQRLTTLSLIIIALAMQLHEWADLNIDPDDNRKRKVMLMENLIGTTAFASLRTTTKLKLNETNDPLYSGFLAQLKTPEKNAYPDSSNKQLYACLKFFQDKIKIYLQETKEEFSALNKLIEYIEKNLSFICIQASDSLNAFLIFETLNDRGIDLSITDLLKNYLFSRVAKKQRKEVKDMWRVISSHIDYKQIPRFLRHVWIADKKSITEKELFAAIKRGITNEKQAFALLESLVNYSSIYAAFDDEHSVVWKDHIRAKNSIAEINLFNVNQCYPVLLCAHQHLNPKEWEKVFHYCAIISFRYSTICKKNPNVLEDVYSQACKNIREGKNSKAKDVFEDLRTAYVPDPEFQETFQQKDTPHKRNTKLTRYILCSLENQNSGTKIDYRTEGCTIEHILPENPANEWSEFFAADKQQQYIYRLGNLTILEENLNRKIENKVYADKLPKYKKSKYKLTSEIEADRWIPEEIEKRQTSLAKIAKTVWKIN